MDKIEIVRITASDNGSNLGSSIVKLIVFELPWLAYSSIA